MVEQAPLTGFLAVNMQYIFSLHANFIGTSQCTSNLSKLVLFPVQDDHVTNFIGPVNVQAVHRIVSMREQSTRDDTNFIETSQCTSNFPTIFLVNMTMMQFY